MLGEYADPKGEAHKYASQCVLDGHRVNIRPYPAIPGAFEVTSKNLKGRIFAPVTTPE